MLRKNGVGALSVQGPYPMQLWMKLHPITTDKSGMFGYPTIMYRLYTYIVTEHHQHAHVDTTDQQSFLVVVYAMLPQNVPGKNITCPRIFIRDGNSRIIRYGE